MLLSFSLSSFLFLPSPLLSLLFLSRCRCRPRFFALVSGSRALGKARCPRRTALGTPTTLHGVAKIKKEEVASFNKA